MLAADGYCDLQRSCGESVLPMVCRVYPRSVRNGRVAEVCTSASCEKTVELIAADTAPLRFVTGELELPFDGIRAFSPDDDEAHSERKRALDILSDRSRTFAERLVLIDGGDCRSNSGLSYAVSVIEYAVAAVGAVSPSIHEVGSAALERICGSAGNYISASESLRAAIPDFDIIFERIIANHMFYMQYPFVSSGRGRKDAYSLLCIACALFRYLAVGAFRPERGFDGFVDVTAGVFRYLEHSGFYSLPVKKLAGSASFSPDDLLPLFI